MNRNQENFKIEIHINNYSIRDSKENSEHIKENSTKISCFFHKMDVHCTVRNKDSSYENFDVDTENLEGGDLSIIFFS